MKAVVHTTTDRIEAQALLTLLQSEGIEAELAGVVDAARLGIGESVLPLRLEVPVEDEARARQVLATPPPAAEPSEDRPRRKKPIIAMGVSVVWPGLGHVYAARPYTGVVLMLGTLGSIIAASGRNGLGAVYVLLVIADAFFARRAVVALNAGRRRGNAAQLAAGVALVGAALLLAVSAPLYAEYQRQQRERELSRISVTCPRGRVVATNTADEPRDVEVTDVVAVRRLQLMGEEVQRVEWSGPRHARLAPGAALEVSVEAQPPFEITGFPMPGELRIAIVVQLPASDGAIGGRFYCTPGRE